MVSCDLKSLLVHFLICIFGIGSWIAINGIWVELPILVQHLPEQWNLPSYMSIVIQLANIGPISYTLASVFSPSILHEKKIIFTILTIGSISCILLSLFWHKTTVVAGSEHSTALLILEFFVALVDCTSSVAFFPFIANFREKYLISYFVGEGFSGFLPSLVAMGQGASNIICVNTSVVNASFINGEWFNSTEYQIRQQYESPHFPVRDFFLFLFAMMLLSALAFMLLNILPQCRNELVIKNDISGISYVRKNSKPTPSATVTAIELSGSGPKISPCGCTETETVVSGQSVAQLLHNSQDDRISSDDESNEYQVSSASNTLSLSVFIYIVFLTALVNGLSNGVLPAIQSYACLPYGNFPFYLSVLLGIMANPVTCFIAYFLPTTNLIAITTITILGSSIASYDLVLAALSPNPLLKDDGSGSIILVASWVLVAVFLTYAKVSIATIFRSQGRRGMLWYGAVTQVGSAVGSIIMFVLINVLYLFVSADPCSS